MARAKTLSADDYRKLAAFRLALRRFVSFAEANARQVGLTPQQHQALLSIKGGYPGRQQITIGELADHLLLKHHSAVELAERLVRGGLVARQPSPTDRRRILLSVTAKGEALLAQLSEANLAELRAASGLMDAFVAAAQDT
jgi:DNA-binding MarR family transcriptional regulator